MAAPASALQPVEATNAGEALQKATEAFNIKRRDVPRTLVRQLG